MKLLALILLSLIFLVSCSGNNVKESSEDIASISDEELLISDDPLLNDNPNYDESIQSDNEIASLEDDLLLGKESTLPEQLVTPTPAPVEAPETISMNSEPAPLSANREVSGLMVLDNETQTWISADKCVHIIKNDRYTEPTCLKRR